MKWTNDKNLNTLLMLAVERGAEVSKTGGNHVRIKFPGVAPQFIPSTPSRNNRSVTNAMQRIRRAMKDGDNSCLPMSLVWF